MKEIEPAKCVATFNAILANIEKTKDFIRRKDTKAVMVGLIEIGGHLGMLEACGIKIDRTQLTAAAVEAGAEAWEIAERRLEKFKETVVETVAAL